MNPLTKILSLFKKPMTNDPFSDDRPEMQIANSMDGLTSPKVQQPLPPDAPNDLSVDSKLVFEMFGLLTAKQRAEFNAAAMRGYCFGCFEPLPKSGGICKTCNGD